VASRGSVLGHAPKDEREGSQYWMLAVMVGFTCLGLYLLSAVGT
jgi:hypothetical protein